MPVADLTRSDSSFDVPLRTPNPPATWPVQADRCAFGLLLIAVVWAPWPLGSNRPWAVALLCLSIWAGVLAGMGALCVAVPARHRGRYRGSALVPLAGLVGFTLLLVAQIIPGLGVGGGTLSIDPFHTRVYLLTTLVYLGAWVLVMLTVTTRERALRLLGTLVAAGLLQAFAAVMLDSSGAHYDLLFTHFDQGERAMGTFPNPDHLAGYMELGLSAGLGWLLSRLGGEQPARGRGWRGNAVGALSFVMSGKMLLRLLLVVMVIALVMTHSRMGNGAFFLSLAMVGALVALRSRQLRRPALWLVASMALVDVFVIGQWVGLDRVVERIRNTSELDAPVASGFGSTGTPPHQEETVEQRLVIPRLSLALVAQRPWLGHGGGTYPTAFPPFKTAGVPAQMLYWDHAHDDYVQVACDTGWVGLALWVLPGVATLVRALRLLGDGQSRESQAFSIAAMMALCTIGLHSLVDFNLHIPANALTFTVLLAAAWALPTSSTRRRRTQNARARDLGQHA